MKKFYYLYQITNKVNGKIYVGVHSTDDLEDGYMGSGKLIRAAILKYGIENFEKTILETFSSSEEMFEREAEVVTVEFVAQESNYNLHNGGSGFDSTFSLKAKEAITPELQRLMTEKSLATRRSRFGSAIPPEMQRRGASVDNREHLSRVRELSLTQEAREKRIATLKARGHQQGRKNSQFGSKWITDGTTNKKIGKADSIPEGWKAGRVLKKQLIAS